MRPVETPRPREYVTPRWEVAYEAPCLLGSGRGRARTIIEGRAGKVTFEPHVVTKRVIRTGLLPKKSAD